jgi:D-sedoheptulose 7-phosphate isomerase
MDLHHHVVELFHQSIDSKMQTLDEVSGHIASCSELIVRCLLSENKILCCGEGQSGALAQIFSANLLNRFHYERPSLPALCLSSDATTLTAITGDNTFNDIFSKQIRALGQAGDALLVIANGNGSGSTLQAIQAAHDREMLVVAIHDQDSSDIASLLLPEDFGIKVPGDNRARVGETQLLVINCLSELIDRQLFGSEE